MTAEAGLALLWLAAAFAVIQALCGIASLTGSGEDARNRAGELVRPFALVQALAAAGAFVALIMVFLASDMSVRLVEINSHSDKPWIYKFAGAWGNHEGSMLLWVSVLAVAGAAVALFERHLQRETHRATLMAQALISLGFYAFLLFSSNPFERVAAPKANGLGLNPLLQDPGLAFHPPTLYFGYVGLSVAFSFAVGAMLTRKVDRAFAKAMRPWVLAAWIFLTLGITAGSYWAYYELGWGGWWFWDPVENASLMPWLAATALLHSVSVLATRDGLRAWTIMLAVLAFSMSMMGTFLVRSGVLTSVHAFAVDPERGSFILALLLIYIGGALILFALRAGTVRQGAPFDPVSREAGLVINNLILTVILGVVIIGTLYPLIAQALDQQVSIGPPYYNPVAGSLTLLLMLLLGAGPVTRWRRDDLRAVLRRVAVPSVIGIVALVALWIAAPNIGWLPWLGLGLSAYLASASIAPLWRRDLRRTPLNIWGMVIAHLGVAIAVSGMASDTAFMQERLVAMRIGETSRVGPFAVRLAAIDPVLRDNWTALEAKLVVTRGDGRSFEMRPQSRFYRDPPTTTSEAAISTRLDGQLYLVLGREGEGDRWQMRLWWKPWVTLIWLGGILIALGGALALVGRVHRNKAMAEAS